MSITPVSKKVEGIIQQFKEEIFQKIQELNFEEAEKIQLLIDFLHSKKFLCQIENNNNTPKKKKMKIIHMEPDEKQCIAITSNGMQCVRVIPKDPNKHYCSTHEGNSKHGSVATDFQEAKARLDVCVVDINGLACYIDHFGNVYNTEDIRQEVAEPRVVGKYEKTSSGYILL